MCKSCNSNVWIGFMQSKDDDAINPRTLNIFFFLLHYYNKYPNLNQNESFLGETCFLIECETFFYISFSENYDTCYVAEGLLFKQNYFHYNFTS